MLKDLLFDMVFSCLYREPTKPQLKQQVYRAVPTVEYVQEKRATARKEWLYFVPKTAPTYFTVEKFTTILK